MDSADVAVLLGAVAGVWALGVSIGVAMAWVRRLGQVV